MPSVKYEPLSRKALLKNTVEQLHLTAINVVTISGDGSLENHRNILQARIVHDPGECFETNLSVANIFVAIKMRTHRTFEQTRLKFAKSGN